MKIILDTFYDHDEQIFKGKLDPKFIGGTWMYLLYKKASEHGIRVILGKTYIDENEFSSLDLILSETVTVNTERLLQTGAKPFLLYSFESPNVDWKFFAFLKRNSSKYQHAFLFNGASRFLSPGVKFHDFYWTNDIRDIEKARHNLITPRENLLVMIASNKKQSSTTNGNILLGLVKGILMKILTNIVPAIRLKDLYATRLQIIRHFSTKPYFSLFGKGWDNTNNLSTTEQKAVKRLKPQLITSKLEVMQHYNFAICFENCVYDGYVTEKIFDCFIAGCIPVYYGAPDIANYVPANTFINASQFKTLGELDDFLTGMSKAEMDTYRQNIAVFIRGLVIENFSDRHFCDDILSLVIHEND